MNSPVGWNPPPRRIAVFRALQLGDLLCAVPALRALRQAAPKAHITLLGLAGAREFVQRFNRYVDDLLVFPGIDAFPEQTPRLDGLPAFFAVAREEQFDLALQMHGSGAQSNDIVARLGAREWAGFVPNQGEEVPGLRLAWPDALPEPQRYLALMRWLGLPAVDAALEFPLTEADWCEAGELIRTSGLQAERTIVLHPGARLPSRRWPAERFAAVARQLAEEGWQVAITGAGFERPLAAEVAQLAAGCTVDLSGRTSLGALAGLVANARLVICNDTGVSHVAAAVHTPSVVIASGSEVRRWAPLDRHRHVVLSVQTPCRPCHHWVCPIGHPCALGVSVDGVLATARHQLKEAHHAV
jgi:ADP-heptose:LPS heptosyltransferase